MYSRVSKGINFCRRWQLVVGKSVMSVQAIISDVTNVLEKAIPAAPAAARHKKTACSQKKAGQ